MKVLLIEDDAKTAAFVKRGIGDGFRIIDADAGGRVGSFSPARAT